MGKTKAQSAAHRAPAASGAGQRQGTQRRQQKSNHVTNLLKIWLFAAALTLATFLAYKPAWHGAMLWDDDSHVTAAPLRSWQGLGRIWWEVGATQQYYPVLHSAFWLQHKLWGDSTTGYHLVNIALHVLNAMLLLAILRRLAITGAFLAAAIFALHPVHVESVAWITELKNTLSTAFYLLALLAYLRFDQTRSGRMFAAAVALFVLGLLSKTVTATLPGAVLVVVWWQRGRLSLRRDVLPLVPMIVLGAAAGLFTAWAERKLIGAQGADFGFTFVERCLIAGRVVWFYLYKLAWPADLIFFYPRWTIRQAALWQYAFPAALAGLLLGLWMLRHRTRSPLTAMLLFCGTLFPVLGFLNVYPFRFSFVADHFQYVACIGIITLGAAGVTLAWQRLRRPAWGKAAAATLLMVLATLTWRQSRMYGDVETLYRTTLARNPQAWLAHQNLGAILVDRGELAEALDHLRETLRLKPDYTEAHNNIGTAYMAQKRYSEAAAEFETVIRARPDAAAAYHNLGNALMRLNRVPEAIANYEKAIQVEPDFAQAYSSLGTALSRLGKLDEAIARYQQALELRPDYAAACTNLANALSAQGRVAEAAKHYETAVKIAPQTPGIYVAYAWCLATHRPADGGDPPRALALASKGVEMTGGRDLKALDVLAAAYAANGDFAQAVRIGEQLMELSRQAGLGDAARPFAERLERYRAGKAYYEAPVESGRRP